MENHPWLEEYHWISLLPPLIAICMAIFTRKAVLSLFIGVAVGVGILTVGDHYHDLRSTQAKNTTTEEKSKDEGEIEKSGVIKEEQNQATTSPSENTASSENRDEGKKEESKKSLSWLESGQTIGVTFITTLAEGYLWKSLADPEHLRVFAFTLLMGAMVGVIYYAGGMHGIVVVVTRWIKSRRSGQVTTWLLGLVVFFDDYANTLLLGNTMRSVTDKLKISREKLAYLVDSTSAPVAGLAFVSTWVAAEIGHIETGFAAEGITDISGMDLFLRSIPYAFYTILALVFVGVVAILKRDFGPMLKAERRALLEGENNNGRQHKLAPLSEDEADIVDELELPEPPPAAPLLWLNAVLPVLTVIGMTLSLLCLSSENYGSDIGEQSRMVYLMNLIGSGDPYLSLVYGALSGLIVAALLAFGQKILTMRQVSYGIVVGASLMFTSLAILWLAWALGDITASMALGKFIGNGLENLNVPVFCLPVIIFVSAGFVAFSTGTSWGTMSILTPIAVSVMLKLQGDTPNPTDPVMLASISAVLAGAIWGDHCSPISDTTILSSQATRCDHIAHVQTQLPYAMVVGAVACVGLLLAGLGVQPLYILAGASIGLIALLLVFGKDVESEA